MKRLIKSLFLIGMVMPVYAQTDRPCQDFKPEAVGSNFIIEEVPSWDDKYVAYYVGLGKYITEEGASSIIDTKYAILDRKTCELIGTLNLGPVDYEVSGTIKADIDFNESGNTILAHVYWFDSYLQDMDDANSMVRVTENTLHLYDYKTLNKIISRDYPREVVQVSNRKIMSADGNAFYSKIAEAPITMFDMGSLSVLGKYIIDEKYAKSLGLDKYYYPRFLLNLKKELEAKNRWSEIEDQPLIRVDGADKYGNPKAVDFTLNGKPYTALWYEDKPVIRDVKTYADKFGVTIKPLPFVPVAADDPIQGKVTYVADDYDYTVPKIETSNVVIEPETTVATTTQTAEPKSEPIKPVDTIKEEKKAANHWGYILLLALLAIGLVIIVYILRRPRK